MWGELQSALCVWGALRDKEMESGLLINAQWIENEFMECSSYAYIAIS